MITRNRPLLPQFVLNKLLLTFPLIYQFKFVNYESGLKTNNGIEDLISRLSNVLDVDGDIIECGCDRCGTSIIMAKYLKSTGTNKKIYAVDTFGEGFVGSELEQERQLGLTQAGNNTFRYNSFRYVKKKFKDSV